MNFVPGPLEAKGSKPVEPILTLDQAHVLRSKVIDKCAEAERQIFRLLRTATETISSRAPLSQKLDALRYLLESDGAPRRAATILRLLKCLEPLSKLRSELAHSTLSLALVEGQRVAVLRNAAAADVGEGQRTMLSLAKLQQTHERLSRVANSLKQAADQSLGSGFPFRGSDGKR